MAVHGHLTSYDLFHSYHFMLATLYNQSMYRLSMHIEKSTITFVEEALDRIKPLHLPVIEIPCPHCHEPIRYPKVAREQDLEHMQTLLNIATDFLRDSGASAAMVISIFERIAAARRKTLRIVCTNL